MPYKNKTYVSLDYDSDSRYYNLMKAWKQSDKTNFNFHDAHDINNLMAYSSEDTIKAKLKERLNNSKIFVLLVGEYTKNLFKYVRWEIDQALKLDLPIIVVNINGKKEIDYDLCPAIIKNELTLHIPFGSIILEQALIIWQNEHFEYRRKKETGSYYFTKDVYQKLNV